MGVSLALVLSSYFWWVDFSAGTPGSGVPLEAHGFPIHYYSVFSQNLPIIDFELRNLAVDVILVFIVCLGILTLWRWRALSSRGRRRI